MADFYGLRRNPRKLILQKKSTVVDMNRWNFENSDLKDEMLGESLEIGRTSYD